MRRVIAMLNRAEELTLTVTLLGLAMVAFVQVIFRYAFGISFTWFEEAGRYLGIFITLLGSGIGVKRGSHFTMDLFRSSVGPAVAKTLQVFAGTVSGGVMLMVAWYGLLVVQRNYGYETTSPTMELPMYLIYLPIPVFSVVISVRCFLTSVKALCPRLLDTGGEIA